MLHDDIDHVLREYFRWARAGCPSDIYYPHADPTQPFRGSSVPSLGLSDDEALWIDEAICQIGRDDKELFTLMFAYYGQKKSMAQLRRFGSRKKISRRLSDAKSFIHGVLYGGTKNRVPTAQMGAMRG